MLKDMNVGQLIAELKKGSSVSVNDTDGGEHVISGPARGGRVILNGKPATISSIMWGLGRRVLVPKNEYIISGYIISCEG